MPRSSRIQTAIRESIREKPIVKNRRAVGSLIGISLLILVLVVSSTIVLYANSIGAFRGLSAAPTVSTTTAGGAGVSSGINFLVGTYNVYNTINNVFAGSITTPSYNNCNNGIGSACQYHSVTAGTQDTNGLSSALGFTEVMASGSTSTPDAYPVEFQTAQTCGSSTAPGLPTSTFNGVTIGIGCIAPGANQQQYGGIFSAYGAGGQAQMYWQSGSNPNTGQWVVNAFAAQTPHTCGTAYSGGTNGFGETASKDTAANLATSTSKNCQLAITLPNGITALSTSAQTFTFSVLDGVSGTTLDQITAEEGFATNPVQSYGTVAGATVAATPACSGAGCVAIAGGWFWMCANQTGIQVTGVSAAAPANTIPAGANPALFSETLNLIPLNSNKISSSALCYGAQLPDAGVTPTTATVTSRQDILDIKVQISETASNSAHIVLVGGVTDQMEPAYFTNYFTTSSTVTCNTGASGFCNNQTAIQSTGTDGAGKTWSTYGGIGTYSNAVMPTSGTNAGMVPPDQLLWAGTELTY